MFGTMPMSATRPCARNPVVTASRTDQTHSNTTRLSMKARSIGTRGSVISGATGRPSAGAAPSTLRSLRWRLLLRNRLQMVLLPRRRIVFEQHRRGAVIGRDTVDDFRERVGESLSF